MPRRKHIDRRVRLPDARYNNDTLSELINKFMYNGKKSTATTMIYDALDIIREKEKNDPIAVLEQALKNSTPLLEVKARPCRWCYLSGACGGRPWPWQSPGYSLVD
jgi:small subunit ribosomal protein S7